MDTGLQEYIKQNYGIDLDEATTMSELDIVTTLNLRDCYISHLDLSKFRNVKILDISYNPIKEIKWGDTSKIEEFSWWGVRMNELDFNLENFPSLKIVRPGQDNLTALDFSNNPQIEEILFSTSHSLKNLILPQNCKLRRINMQGVLIPFVDLTCCNNLEYVSFYGQKRKYRRRTIGRSYISHQCQSGWCLQDCKGERVPQGLRDAAWDPGFSG